VSLRPERISFGGPTKAVVSTHTFLGRHARTVVQAMGQPIIVSTTDLVSPAPGTALQIGWKDEDAQLLDESPGDVNGNN
jgi:hypothetical protein